MPIACHPFVTNCDFDIHPNDPTDQTAKIQAAFDTAISECVPLWLQAGVYLATQLTVPRGLRLIGAGMGGVVNTKGTVFMQPKDFDGSLFVNAALPASEWQHWTQFEHIHLAKEAGGIATQGHGIDISNPIGEGFRFYDVMVEGFPQSGVRLQRGGTPMWISDLHLFRNGEYGLDLAKGVGDRAHCLSIERISGDDNAKALIRLKAFGDLSEHVSIKHIKSEAHAAGKQPYVIELENIYQINVDIEHIGGMLSSAAIPTADALVRIVGDFTGSVNMRSAYIPGYKAALRDHRTNADAVEQGRIHPMLIAAESWSFPNLYGSRQRGGGL